MSAGWATSGARDGSGRTTGTRADQEMIYDIFLTHAWRYHDDWNRFASLLDSLQSFEWRNFSLPWYDPAFDPRSDVGGKLVRKSLENQVAPVHCVILLNSVYETRSARHWVDLELELAHRHKKPILVAPTFGESTVSEAVEKLCDGVISWQAAAVAEAIRNCVDNRDGR
jgi:hypothetical protein